MPMQVVSPERIPKSDKHKISYRWCGFGRFPSESSSNFFSGSKNLKKINYCLYYLKNKLWFKFIKDK
jgi:hypothetical protein